MVIYEERTKLISGQIAEQPERLNLIQVQVSPVAEIIAKLKNWAKPSLFYTKKSRNRLIRVLASCSPLWRQTISPFL